MRNVAVRILVSFGSLASIGFGIWHFWVPAIWKWYSFMDPTATELIIAVRAINVFFSLSLVLFGLMNLFLAFGPPARFSMAVVLAATCLLWACRVAMQLIYPQGSMNPAVQYSMLAIFCLALGAYAVSLVFVLTDKTVPR